MSAASPGRWLLAAASVVVAATVVAAVVAIGPPSAQRDARLDARRLQDLARIADLVDAHAGRSGALPRDLDALATPGLRLPVDPGDGGRYAYEVAGPRSYRLCAVFATDSALADERMHLRAGDEWSHGAGRHCFERRVPESDADAKARVAP